MKLLLAFVRRGTIAVLLATFLVANSATYAQRQSGTASRDHSVTAVHFDSARLAEMDAAIEQAIADKKCPGGVLWLEHKGSVYSKAFGNRASSAEDKSPSPQIRLTAVRSPGAPLRRA